MAYRSGLEGGQAGCLWFAGLIRQSSLLLVCLGWEGIFEKWVDFQHKTANFTKTNTVTA